ncbi:putative NAD/NADP octopine/nopaline dehydrogenase [Astrocystis sublimbata]|nr:putative NAD/NADP octopine/nopaline dehydrogenase [Astrocystis sublimbata]
MIASVSIIGAGNCGCAFAADLENRGIRVLLYAHPDHSRNVDTIRGNGYLDSIGKVEGRFYPTVSTDMEETLQFSNVVIIAVPSYGQENILSELEKFDVSKHIIIAASGNFFTLVAHKRIRARYLLETSASPYGSRMVGGQQHEQQHLAESWYGINVFGFKTVMPIGALPTDIGAHLRAEIGTIFPGSLQWCSNVVEAALYNFNGVLHPITAIMNAGWIEHTKGDFFFYQEGMSLSVTKIMQEVDNERVAIGNAYGSQLSSCLEQMNTYYGLNHKSLNEFAKGSSLHSTMKLCPTSMEHRYLLEDLPYVLVPWYELGLKAGRQSPFIQSLILWSSMINNTDYLRTGRNLKSLGFADWSRDEIVDMISMTTSDAPASELLQYTELRANRKSTAMQYMSQYDLGIDLPKL